MCLSPDVGVDEDDRLADGTGRDDAHQCVSDEIAELICTNKSNEFNHNRFPSFLSCHTCSQIEFQYFVHDKGEAYGVNGAEYEEWNRRNEPVGERRVSVAGVLLQKHLMRRENVAYDLHVAKIQHQSAHGEEADGVVRHSRGGAEDPSKEATEHKVKETSRNNELLAVPERHRGPLQDDVAVVAEHPPVIGGAFEEGREGVGDELEQRVAAQEGVHDDLVGVTSDVLLGRGACLGCARLCQRRLLV